ncbi:MAG: hypothetical protein QE263_02985 [Vampirovibrionales bacterium]|nr:hypothetical protein [Vampirovibrionales bacterium]
MLGLLTQGAIRLNNILLAKGPILPSNATTAQLAEFELAKAAVPKVGNWFRSDNVASTIGKEVVGINAPKAVNVRRFGEFLDAMVSELGNTIGYFVGGYALSALMNKLRPRLVGDFHEQAERLKGLSEVLKNKIPLSHVGGEFAVKTFYAGKSVAFMAILGSFIWAMPFFRNVITANKLGTTKFTEIISGNSLLAKETPEEFKKNKRRYLRTGLAILGTGLLAGVGGFAIARKQAARLASEAINFKTLVEPKWLKMMDKKEWFTGASWLFKDGKFSNLNGAHAFWFWGIPAYAGWFHASREKNERTEIVFKAINFFVMFFGVSAALKALLVRPQFYTKELIHSIKADRTARPWLDVLTLDKELIEKHGAKLGFTKDKIQELVNIDEAHNTIGYFGSTAALFISNWLANDLSQWATAKRMTPKRQALGEETLSRLQPSSSTSTSVRRNFSEFTQTAPL